MKNGQVRATIRSHFFPVQIQEVPVKISQKNFSHFHEFHESWKASQQHLKESWGILGQASSKQGQGRAEERELKRGSSREGAQERA